jgi:hypothetical protein
VGYKKSFFEESSSALLREAQPKGAKSEAF